MAQAAYPALDDFATFLSDTGFALASSLQASLLPGPLAQAIREVERDTSRCFLALEDTRTFDLPTGGTTISFDGEELASCSGVTVSGKAAILAPAANPDCRLLDQNGGKTSLDPGDPRYKPYWGLELRPNAWSVIGTLDPWGTVQVTGRWGFSLAVPDSVWGAALMRAGWLVLPALINAALPVDGPPGQTPTFKVKSWTRSGTTQTYSAEGFTSLGAIWCGEDGRGGAYRAVVEAFRKEAGYL